MARVVAGAHPSALIWCVLPASLVTVPGSADRCQAAAEGGPRPSGRVARLSFHPSASAPTPVFAWRQRSRPYLREFCDFREFL